MLPQRGERRVIKAIPVYMGKGTNVPAMHAQVDEDVFEKASKFRWYLDKTSGAVYADIPSKDGVAHREVLHRFVMGCQKGDNSVVKFLSEDKIDCRRENLAFDKPRNLTKWNTDKYFPSRATKFLRYVEENHFGTAVHNLVRDGIIHEYGRKKISVHVDSGDASPATLTALLDKFCRDEFGFKGEVLVKRIPQTPVGEDNTAKKKELLPPPPPPTTTTPAFTGSAKEIMQRVGSVFGIDYAQEAKLEFCNFAIRQGDDILEFNFTRKRATTTPKSVVEAEGGGVGGHLN